MGRGFIDEQEHDDERADEHLRNANEILDGIEKSRPSDKKEVNVVDIEDHKNGN